MCLRRVGLGIETSGPAKLLGHDLRRRQAVRR
jgi:hypothetical protein